MQILGICIICSCINVCTRAFISSAQSYYYRVSHKQDRSRSPSFPRVINGGSETFRLSDDRCTHVHLSRGLSSTPTRDYVGAALLSHVNQNRRRHLVGSLSLLPIRRTDCGINAGAVTVTCHIDRNIDYSYADICFYRD